MRSTQQGAPLSALSRAGIAASLVTFVRLSPGTTSDRHQTHRSGRNRPQIRETARLVPADGAGLEQPPADRVTTGGASNMVDDSPWHPGSDRVVGEVVDRALDPLVTAPRAVQPVRVAAVAAPDVQRNEHRWLDVDRHG